MRVHVRQVVRVPLTTSVTAQGLGVVKFSVREVEKPHVRVVMALHVIPIEMEHGRVIGEMDARLVGSEQG